jgi:ABC-type methionine transport system ATPase subunit
MALLEFRNVTKRFHDGLREVVVLDDISFELFEGETVGVLASRRAGKTTLLRVAAGLEIPDEGEVRWRGSDLAGLNIDARSRARRLEGITLAQGDRRVSDSITVLEHVATPLYSDGFNMRRAEECAWSALGMVEIPEFGRVSTSSLRLAERVRVELARAIARSPALLLFDEPAVLPQPREAQALYALIHSLPKQLDMSLLIGSEDITALRGARRVLNLDNGRLYSTESRRKVIDMLERRGSGGRGNSADAS